METNAYLKEHYEKGGENGRLLSRHGRIEFLTTVRYVEKYLHEGMKIIEIGAVKIKNIHTILQSRAIRWMRLS